jgi:hypothetical protein
MLSGFSVPVKLVFILVVIVVTIIIIIMLTLLFGNETVSFNHISNGSFLITIILLVLFLQ